MAEYDPNRDFKDVEVLTAAELMQTRDLAQRVDRMVENRSTVFLHNVDHLCKKFDIKQARLCEDKLEGLLYSTQLSGYKKKGKDIPLRTMALVGAAFGYTLEQMCGQLLDREEVRVRVGDKTAPRPHEEYQSYKGTYEFAYFAGEEASTTAASLAEGVLTVYLGNAVDGVATLMVEAMLDCSPEEKQNLLNRLHLAEKQESGRVISCIYEKEAEQDLSRYYRGRLELTDRNATFTLHQQKGSDSLGIVLRNRVAANGGESYRGGLGTMSSSAWGPEQTPCVRAVALSRGGFRLEAPEELAEHLLLAPAEVELGQEMRDIIAYMRMVLTAGEASPLGALHREDQDFLMESFVTRKLTQILKRSVCGYYQVSLDQDARVYKAYCGK